MIRSQCLDPHCRDGRRRWSWRTRIWGLAYRGADWLAGRSRHTWLVDWAFDGFITSMARDHGLTTELQNEILGTRRRR